MNSSEQHALPLLLRPAVTTAELQRVALIRHQAYARHVPDFAAQLKLPERADDQPGSLVFLAEAKDDGRPVGTMRLQSNRYAPLPLEASVDLPTPYREALLIEATRLGVEASDVGAVARNVLFKACYMASLKEGARWIVVTARASLDRIYEHLLFEDVFPGGQLFNMKHVGNLPHRVMALDVLRANEVWSDRSHPLYHFMTGIQHREVQLGRFREETVLPRAGSR